jgi:hypothetical protein
MFPRNILKFSLAALALICFAIGCKTTPPPGENSSVQYSGPHYAFLFGQKFRTKTGLFIFFFTSEPDYLYLGKNGFGPKELPADVSKKYIGQTYPPQEPPNIGDIVIFDVAPAGSVLTIHAETHEVTPLSGIRGSGGYPMGFICQLNCGDKSNYVFTEFIQSHKKVSGKAPNEYLNPELVEKIK